MVVGDRSMNGRRSRGPSPNGHHSDDSDDSGEQGWCTKLNFHYFKSQYLNKYAIFYQNVYTVV